MAQFPGCPFVVSGTGHMEQFAGCLNRKPVFLMLSLIHIYYGATITCYTKTSNLTNHKEADFTLLPLYRPPPHVV